VNTVPLSLQCCEAPSLEEFIGCAVAMSVGEKIGVAMSIGVKIGIAIGHW
jgi:hypothetical protein